MLLGTMFFRTEWLKLITTVVGILRTIRCTDLKVTVATKRTKQEEKSRGPFESCCFTLSIANPPCDGGPYC